MTIAAQFIGGPKHGDVWAMRQLSQTINGSTTWHTKGFETMHVAGMVYELRHLDDDVAWYGFEGFTPCECGARSTWGWWRGLR